MTMVVPGPRRFGRAALALAWVAGVLAGGSAVEAASFPDPAVPASLGVNAAGIALTEDDFAKLKELKVHYIRRGILWTQIEKEKGKYDFTSADQLIAELEKHGIGLLCTVAFGNTLYEPDQHWMGVRTAAGREGFANYAAALVGRYKGRKIIYEIWNEPNGPFWKPTSDPKQYMDMVDVAVPRMRQADPGCTIVAPSLYHIGWNKAIQWFEVCLQRDLHKKVDGISFHSYGDRNRNAAVERNIGWHEDLRKLLGRYGAPADYPVVQSEYGINLQSQEFSGTTVERQRQQAQAVTRNYLVTLMLKMPLNIHYEWKTRESDKSKGLLNADGTVTAAYEALKVLVARLDGCAFERRLAGYDSSDYVLVFRNGSGGTILAAWTTGAAHSVKVSVAGTEAVDVWDMAGAKSVAGVADGRITVELGPAPGYYGLGRGSAGDAPAGADAAPSRPVPAGPTAPAAKAPAAVRAGKDVDPDYPKVARSRVPLIQAMPAGVIEKPARVPWRLYVPPEATDENKLPLVFFLHGAGRRGDDNVGPMDLAYPFWSAEAQKKHPCLVLAPQCRRGTMWATMPADHRNAPADQAPNPEMAAALEVLDSVLRERPVDRSRIYVTGQSMGGFGTWDVLYRRPGFWAAAVPICGGGDPSKAALYKDVPVWAWHGANDAAVPPENSRELIAALKKAGGEPRYSELPGVGHGSWVPAYGSPELLEWLFAQKRK